MMAGFSKAIVRLFILSFCIVSLRVGVHAQAGTGVVWSADHETANLKQWLTGGVSQASWDSGNCTRPANGVSTAYAHSGSYSMQMTINTTTESGCRQFRSPESKTGNTYYYSAWVYVPVYESSTNGWWNVFQFKSNNGSTEDPFWVIDMTPRSTGGPNHLRLRWKEGHPGPFAGQSGLKTYEQTIVDIPVGKWVQIEAYLKQSTTGNYNGQLTVWQDGVQLWDMVGVKTKFDGGDQRWSINNYAAKTGPQVSTLYWDDAVVATSQQSVAPQTLALITPALSDATLNTLYSANLLASGGALPYTFTITSGTLPTGLSLSSDGLLTGTPTTLGATTFVIRVVDGLGASVSRQFSIFVHGCV